MIDSCLIFRAVVEQAKLTNCFSKTSRIASSCWNEPSPNSILDLPYESCDPSRPSETILQRMFLLQSLLKRTTIRRQWPPGSLIPCEWTVLSRPSLLRHGTRSLNPASHPRRYYRKSTYIYPYSVRYDSMTRRKSPPGRISQPL